MSQNEEVHTIDESSEEEDEHYEEGVLESVTKTGVLERKKDGEKRQKFYWYLLTGGTLYEYRTIKHTEPKETFQLKGCEIIESDKPISTALEIRKGGKQILLLLPQSQETRAEWSKALRHSLEKEPRPAPIRVKAKKGTLKMRMKKTLAGKVATSAAGKFVAKSSIPEEVERLISSLKTIMITHIGEEEAHKVEDNIIKLYVKCFCLEEDGQLKLEEFIPMDQPMRQAFSAISKLRDLTVARKGPADEAINEGIKKIRDNLHETETQLTNLLMPHLKPHTISKIAYIFRYVNDADFLRKAIVCPFPGEQLPKNFVFLEEEVDNLCMAMDKYLSIPYYQDD